MFDEDDYTFEVILQRMLDTVPDTIDKREGSIIYDALSPAATELAQAYIWLQNAIDLAFVDTSSEEYLERLCNQIGITRNEATSAIKQGNFYDEDGELFDVDVGSRFTCEDLYWEVIEQISTGIYQVQCETAGVDGNNVTGTLVPVDYIDGLGTATLTDLLVPGEDEETDDELRERYLEQSSNVAFGGNVQDYKDEVKAIDGIGAVKVIPVWNGGGTVKLIILNSDYDIASDVLIENVQDIICPDSSDQGLGVAPIGHQVTVVTPEEIEINITATIVLSESMTTSVEELIEEAIEEYLLELREAWEDEDSIVVRISRIENAILNVDGVLDVSDTTINSDTSNIELSAEEYVPILGIVEVSES